MTHWWQTFFDAEYLRLWEGSAPPEKTEREADGLCALLGIDRNSRLLDAPCGQGRISLALAQRGAYVLGVDYSAELIAEAQRRRLDVPQERLKYHQADLRQPLPESGFDVALNIFSSLGYGTESEDVAILSTLRAAVRPGGTVFIETIHRDTVTIRLSQSSRQSYRLADGTLFVEEPRFDAVTGRVDSTWYWSGPASSGQRCSSMRIYTATELVRLLNTAGLRVKSAFNGCSSEPFLSSGPGMSSRIGIQAIRD